MNNYDNKPPAEDKETSIYRIFLKSLGLCLAISFVLIMLYALILSFTSMSDSSMKTSIQVIMIVSITVSSIYGGKKASRKGWLFGAALGLVFTVLLVPLGIGFGQSFAFDKYFVAKIFMGSVVGLIGGIIGVNLK